MEDVYKNTEEYNTDKKRKIFTVFADMIVDMINNKKLTKKPVYQRQKTKHFFFYYTIIF